MKTNRPNKRKLDALPFPEPPIPTKRCRLSAAQIVNTVTTPSTVDLLKEHSLLLEQKSSQPEDDSSELKDEFAQPEDESSQPEDRSSEFEEESSELEEEEEDANTPVAVPVAVPTAKRYAFRYILPSQYIPRPSPAIPCGENEKWWSHPDHLQHAFSDHFRFVRPFPSEINIPKRSVSSRYFLSRTSDQHYVALFRQWCMSGPCSFPQSACEKD